MKIGWLLIVYLSSGSAGYVVSVDDAIECIVRSQFEMRYNPRISHTYCSLGVETST